MYRHRFRKESSGPRPKYLGYICVWIGAGGTRQRVFEAE